MTHLPNDPVAPREPLRVPRSRPGVVTVAAVLMIGGAISGLLGGLASMLAASGIGRDFGAGLEATPGLAGEKAQDLGRGALGFFLGSGAAVTLLAVMVITFALGVLRGNLAARFGAMVLLPIALCCGSTASLGTLSLGRGQDLRVNLEGTDVEIGGQLSHAVPPWFSSLSAGLACPQVLAYLGAIVLLALPATVAFFRRRPPAPSPPGRSPGGRPGGGGAEGAHPEPTGTETTGHKTTRNSNSPSNGGANNASNATNSTPPRPGGTARPTSGTGKPIRVIGAGGSPGPRPFPRGQEHGGKAGQAGGRPDPGELGPPVDPWAPPDRPPPP